MLIILFNYLPISQINLVHQNINKNQSQDIFNEKIATSR